MKARIISLVMASTLAAQTLSGTADATGEVRNANGEPSVAQDGSLDSSVRQNENFDEITDSEVLAKIIPAAQQSAFKDSLLEPSERLEVDSPVAKQTPDGAYVVNFPFVSDRETDIASMKIFLNRGGEVETTYQLSLRQVDTNSGYVQTRVNGKEAINRLVTASDSADSNIQPYTIFEWSKVKQCLNNAGVASWVVAGISVVCAAAWVATAGLGCVGCIAAAATVTGATAGRCAAMGLSNG